jgi:hypothetical protein
VSKSKIKVKHNVRLVSTFEDKVGIVIGHTQVVGFLIPILIMIPCMQVAPYIPIQHWVNSSTCTSRMGDNEEIQHIFLSLLSLKVFFKMCLLNEITSKI